MQFRNLSMWLLTFGVLAIMIASTSAVISSPKVVGCYGNVDSEQHVAEGDSAYQLFQSRKSGKITKIAFSIGWDAGDSVAISLCEGADVSMCLNEQGAEASPRNAAGSPVTKTIFSLGEAVEVTAGTIYFWRVRVERGSNVRLGLVSSPARECKWSLGYMQDGVGIVAIFPQPYLRYTAALEEACPAGMSCITSG